MGHLFWQEIHHSESPGVHEAVKLIGGRARTTGSAPAGTLGRLHHGTLLIVLAIPSLA
jgi:hypothetical protein